MAHIPINHQLRAVFRTLAGLSGAYVLLFGIFGTARTWGDPLFDRSNTWVLGLRTNLAFALLSIAMGLILLVGAIIGRNVDHYINLVAGGVFIGAGMVMMTLMQTDANFLNFSMTTVIVSFVLGLIMGIAGLYGKTGSREAADSEEAFRRSMGPDMAPSRLATAGRHGHRPPEEHPDVHRFG